MSCSFTIIISCMVFFFLLKLCFLCAANSLNILPALFPPPFLLPPHPLHTQWNQGLLGWVLCCTGNIFFFFKSLSSLFLSWGVCVCVCGSVRFKPDAGHLWYLISSYWQCFIPSCGDGRGTSEVPFDEPPSPQWSVNSFHCGYETLCVTHRERTEGSFVRTVCSVICDSYGTSKEFLSFFFFLHLLCSFSFESWNWSQVVHKECMKLLNLKRVYISLSLWLLRSRHVCT